MTVIACKKFNGSIVIAADSQTSLGYNHIIPNETKKTAKIVVTNGFCFGSSGEAFETVFLEIFSRNRRPESASVIGVIDFLMDFEAWGKGKCNDFKSSNHYIFIIDGKIFQTWGGIVTEERESYTAIGSGENYAMTALYLGKTPEEAVQVAIDLTPWCCGPIYSKVISNAK
jgi:ATP-dependent protease HslVU (ClpYQ) peptidase subunit